MARLALAIVLAGGALFVVGQAGAGDNAEIRRAYHSAQQCYVANGYLYGTFKDAGDLANANLFDAKAKRAFDAANGYAIFLHLSREQIEADLSRATDSELRKLMADKAYLTSVAKDCKSKGLM
jgi:hypothetical protein